MNTTVFNGLLDVSGKASRYCVAHGKKPDVLKADKIGPHILGHGQTGAVGTDDGLGNPIEGGVGNAGDSAMKNGMNRFISLPFLIENVNRTDSVN